MEVFQKTLSFLAGLFIVIVGLFDECPRVAAITVGLLLMGVFTVPQALDFIKVKLRKEDE